MMLVFAVALLLAHSFYPAECCGGSDCDAISQFRVRIVDGGYLVDGRHYVAEMHARNAPDGKYHACFWPSPDKLHCFFRPNIGS